MVPVPAIAGPVAILTSLLDPDAVTRQAFQEQERRLAAMVRTRSAAEFRRDLTSRLGKGQAQALAERYYRQ